MYSPNIYSQPNKYSPSTCLSLKSKTNKSPYGYNLFTKHCLKPNFFLQFILKEQKKTTQKERRKKCAVSSWKPVKVWAMGSGHSPLWAVGFCSRQSLAVGCHSGTEGDWTTSKKRALQPRLTLRVRNFSSTIYTKLRTSVL